MNLSSLVLDCRGRLTADNRRSLVDKIVIFESRHHEQGKVKAPGLVAFQDGITYMPAPHRQALALTLFKVAPPHDRPLRVAGKYPPARFHLVVDVDSANESPKPAGGT